jgi:hypothetical protein
MSTKIYTRWTKTDFAKQLLETSDTHGGEYEDDSLLMSEAASTSETPANFYQTTRSNIPEDSYLQTTSCSYPVNA